MPDITSSLDAIVRRGAVISPNGDMPIIGYNPQQRFENADMVEATQQFERQEIGNGGFFRRDNFLNAAGLIVRISGWYIENPPVSADNLVAPAQAIIGSGDVALTITGTGFGTDTEQVRVLLRWHPSFNQGGVSREGRMERAATITTVIDTQIVCSMNFDQEWRHSGLRAGPAELVVQRLDRGLEGDPVRFTLVGG